MSRRPRLFLQDILNACTEVTDIVRGLDFESFKSDKLRIAATVRRLEVIGEASRRLPDETRNAMPSVPWGKIIGMRNLLAHAYYNVDRMVVRTVATQRIPELVRALESYLRNIEPSP